MWAAIVSFIRTRVMLSGITVTKELKQFHSRSGIIHLPECVAFVWYMGPNKNIGFRFAKFRNQFRRFYKTLSIKL
jgi:hypothetical protein